MGIPELQNISHILQLYAVFTKILISYFYDIAWTSKIFNVSMIWLYLVLYQVTTYLALAIFLDEATSDGRR